MVKKRSEIHSKEMNPVEFIQSVRRLELVLPVFLFKTRNGGLLRVP